MQSSGIPEVQDEQAPLFVILPSAQSTKKPSVTNLQNYATLGDKLVQNADDEGGLELLKQQKKASIFSSPLYLCKALVCSLPGKICSALLILVGFFIIIGLHPSGKHSVTKSKTTAKFGFRRPLSTLSPVHDLNVLLIGRPPTTDPPPLVLRQNPTQALPTNIWYLNLMLAGTGEPSNFQNVFTVPYLVDVAGIIPGIHISPQEVSGGALVENMVSNPFQGVVLGVAEDASTNHFSQLSKKYTIPTELSSHLAVTLDWVSVSEIP